MSETLRLRRCSRIPTAPLDSSQNSSPNSSWNSSLSSSPRFSATSSASSFLPCYSNLGVKVKLVAWMSFHTKASPNSSTTS